MGFKNRVDEALDMDGGGVWGSNDPGIRCVCVCVLMFVWMNECSSL